MPVQVAPAEKRSVKNSTEYIGTIKSLSAVALQPQVEGYITRIAVKSGDHVRRGQILMSIDPLKQQATVNTQEATQQSKRAQLELARTELERRKKLAADGVIARQDLDQAQAAYDAAKADVDALQATVREQREQLRYYSITAPIAGVVGDLPVRVGDRVSTTTALTTIDSGQDLELNISIPAEKARQIHVGTPVEIEADPSTPNAQPYRTKISFVSPRIDEQDQLLLVKAQVPRGDARFRNDQLVHAHVIWSESPAVVLPFYAVSRLAGQLFAFTAEKNGSGYVAKQQQLQVGDMSGPDYVVLGGIKEGDPIVESNVQMMVDGMAIQPIQPQDGTDAPANQPSTDKKAD